MVRTLFIAAKPDDTRVAHAAQPPAESPMKTRFLPLQAPDSLSLAAAAIFWPDVVPTWSFGTPIEYGLPATVASMVMSGTLAAWVAASSAGVPGCAPTAARPLTDTVWKDVASFSYLSFTSSSAKVTP